MGRAAGEGYGNENPGAFLSARPVGERLVNFDHTAINDDISIHAPPRGERQEGKGARKHPAEISIHAPRVESDYTDADGYLKTPEFLSALPVWGTTVTDSPDSQATLFLSTLPMRGATRALPFAHVDRVISIHAPRAGSDGGHGPAYLGHSHFYPRSPGGERRALLAAWGGFALFLSTLPVRGATPRMLIRAPPPGHFYPRSPCGERR